MTSLVFDHGNGYHSVSQEEYDPIQEQELRLIKNEGMTIDGFEKISTYDRNVRFANKYRKNEDGSRDYVIGAYIIDEFPTGHLPKPAHRVLHVNSTQNKKLLQGSENDYSIIEVPSSEIVSTFKFSLPVDEMEDVLVKSVEKGVNYYE